MRAAIKMGYATGANKSHNDINGNDFWGKKLGILDDIDKDVKKIAYGLGIGYPQDDRPRWESDDNELLIGAGNGSRITLTDQDVHPRTGQKMRKAILVNIKGNENKVMIDPYGNKHIIPETADTKINTSVYKRDIKITEIK